MNQEKPVVRGYRYVMVCLAALGAATSGCGREKPPVDPEELMPLLVEIHLLQARLSSFAPDTTAHLYVDSLVRKYGITRDEFRETMQYYAGHPEEYVVLMDSVVDQMRMMRPSAEVEEDDPLYQRAYRRVFGDTVADTSGTADP